MPPHRLILDCDPGVDDAFAMMLAFAAPEKIEMLGVTCVAGNRPLDQTAYNARRLCALAGRPEIPVYAGCARPIMWAEGEPVDVHGKDGLGDVSLPEPKAPLRDGHAVQFIIDTVMREPEKTVTLCCIGPMTNLALAIVMEPRIVPRIRELVFMGGAAFRMAMYRVSEFNFYSDPHAAHIVLSAGIPQTMFGLDITYQAEVNPGIFQRLDALPGPAPKALADMLRTYASMDPRLHDVVATAYLIEPGLFDGVEAHVSVEYTSPTTRGLTVARWTPPQLAAGYQTNTRVITKTDPAAFFDLMLTYLARY